jgi:hypothetical protein
MVIGYILQAVPQTGSIGTPMQKRGVSSGSGGTSGCNKATTYCNRPYTGVAAGGRLDSNCIDSILEVFACQHSPWPQREQRNELLQ